MLILLKLEKRMIQTGKKVKPKVVNISLIACTSISASSREDWYFDIGGVKKYLVDIKSYSTSFVTFGDGEKVKLRE